MTMVRCAGRLIIMAEFKATEYLKVAARERITYTVMVPAMYNLCLLQPAFDSYELAHRRCWWRADAGGHDREAGRQDSGSEADELLRLDRNHISFNHYAR